jgi:hypothetical protein
MGAERSLILGNVPPRTPIHTGSGKIFDIFIFGKKVLTKLNFGAILRESRDEIFEKGGKRK